MKINNVIKNAYHCCVYNIKYIKVRCTIIKRNKVFKTKTKLIKICSIGPAGRSVLYKNVPNT
jgi:hypothetical protein